MIYAPLLSIDRSGAWHRGQASGGPGRPSSAKDGG